MDKDTFYNKIYTHIENCASLEFVINECDKHKDILSVEDVIKIIRYWKSYG